MITNDVLKIASTFLNISSELSPYLTAEEDDTVTTSEEVSTHFNLLVECFNLTYMEVATDFLPLKYQEIVFVNNKKIDISSLTKLLKDVFSIKSSSGRNVKFSIIGSYIEVATNGYLTITYSYYPSNLGQFSTVDNFSGRASQKCLALGVAAEYCYINGFYDDAQAWNTRFRQALQIACQNKAPMVMPKRRWL